MNSSLPVRHIFRWDLDKTYLHTEFDTWRDLVRVALLKPEQRANIPGADSLLRELTRASELDRVVLTFISGSPTQMRRKLEQKFALDGIRPDTFILKPQLENFLRGRFKAVRGQVGYKLDALLRVRSMHPIAPETLFGDDAEQDAFIYSLYADVVSGAVDLDGLGAILRAANVYHETADGILRHAAAVERQDTVRRIFIHLDRRSPPGRFLPLGPRIVPISNYFQAALVLFADGVMDAAGVLRVAADMMQRADFGLAELATAYQDLARRGQLSRTMTERLIAGTPDTAEELPPGFAERLWARLIALAPLQDPPPREWSGPPDYLEVLSSDHAMLAALKEEALRRRGLL
jgi:hypothetical protein